MSRRRSTIIIMSATHVTIGELVRLTGIRYSTIKYYTEEGLLVFEQLEENLTRRYDRTKTIARLAEIQRLKAEGRTIPEIKSVLDQTE